MTDLTDRQDAPLDEGATEAPAHATWALVLICIAQLMVVLDATIATIALPYIGKDLHIQGTSLQWVITGYALAFGALLLLGGRLGDLYGRRKIFVAGLGLFAVASLLGGIATNESLLLGARALQGLGAALASPAALALITTTFPAGAARSRAFAVYAAMSGAGGAVGLILGGWLTGLDPSWGWRLTFLINVPIGIFAAVIAPRVLSESESHPGELDLLGAVTGTLGLLGIVYGLSRAGTSGWSDGLVIVSLVAGVVILAGFVMIERRVEHPLLPLVVFASRTRAASYAAMFLAPAAMFAMFFYLSLYVQNVKGYSPLHAGLSFLPFTAGIVVGAGLGSSLVTRIDPRYVAGVGTLLAACGLFGYSRLPYDTTPPLHMVTGAYLTHILPFIVLMSFGMGLTFVALTLTAVHRLRAEESGIGSGVLNTMQQVGGALGLSILATVANRIDTHRANELADAARQAGGAAPAGGQKAMEAITKAQVFTEGATWAFLVGAILMLVSSLIVWTLLNVKHEELSTEDTPEGVGV